MYIQQKAELSFKCLNEKSGGVLPPLFLLDSAATRGSRFSEAGSGGELLLIGFVVKLFVIFIISPRNYIFPKVLVGQMGVHLCRIPIFILEIQICIVLCKQFNLFDWIRKKYWSSSVWCHFIWVTAITKKLF